MIKYEEIYTIKISVSEYVMTDEAASYSGQEGCL